MAEIKCSICGAVYESGERCPMCAENGEIFKDRVITTETTVEARDDVCPCYDENDCPYYDVDCDGIVVDDSVYEDVYESTAHPVCYDDAPPDLSDWHDIVAISVSTWHIVGLKRDGTVVAVENNAYGQCDVADWCDIVAISAGGDCTAGVKADGTVVVTGSFVNNGYDVSDWRDIISVAVDDTFMIGLKQDGTVIATGNDSYGKSAVANWCDITAVALGGTYIAGLKKDGTVVAIDRWRDAVISDDEEAISFDERVLMGVAEWQDVAKIYAGVYDITGVKKDGTIVERGIVLADLSSWNDIVSIATGQDHVVGLKRDGTVVVILVAEDSALCPYTTWTDIALLQTWTDIVEIAAGGTYTVGLKQDGTVVVAGRRTWVP